MEDTSPKRIENQVDFWMKVLLIAALCTIQQVATARIHSCKNLQSKESTNSDIAIQDNHHALNLSNLTSSNPFDSNKVCTKPSLQTQNRCKKCHSFEILNKNGNYYLSINQADQAIPYFMQAVDIALFFNNNAKLSIAASNLAYAHLKCKNYREAKFWYYKALGINIILNNKKETSICYSRLGEILWYSQKESRTDTVGLTNIYSQSIKSNNNLRYSNSTIHPASNQHSFIHKNPKHHPSESGIKKMNNSDDEPILVVVILCSTSIIVAIFFLSKKITSKAIQNSTEIELRLRRSQLNPHFIYNSLNSIQKFIWANNPEQASIYLSNFSTLMRKRLECLRQDEILLSKEIEILKIYLNLEKQRLKNGFEYTIETSPNLKPDEIKITPMLIQPFIENAIWHGIAPLPNDIKGNITIKYSRNKKFLNVYVEDNGIGINQSIENKTNQTHPHKSSGINITIEQFMLAYKAKNIHFCHDIKIVDVSNQIDKRRGTAISYSIPLIDLF